MIGLLCATRIARDGVNLARMTCDGAVAQSEQARDVKILILWAVVGLTASWVAGPLDAASVERDDYEISSVALMQDALSATSQRWAKSARQATPAPWGARQARANFN